LSAVTAISPPHDAADLLAITRRVSTAVWLLAAGVVLLGMSAAVWVLLSLSRPDRDAPAAAPQKKQAREEVPATTKPMESVKPNVRIHVRSEPSGAEIIEGRQRLGKTPAWLEFVADERKHLLLLTLAGYKPLTLELLAAGAEQDLDVAKLEPDPPLTKEEPPAAKPTHLKQPAERPTTKTPAPARKSEKAAKNAERKADTKRADEKKTDARKPGEKPEEKKQDESKAQGGQQEQTLPAEKKRDEPKPDPRKPAPRPSSDPIEKFDDLKDPTYGK
jgi:hypothetical protein